MLERLAQLRVALIEFLEQPHVLDGDDRLSSKGLEQSDLFLGERADFQPADMITPMGIPSRSNGMASTVRTPTLLAKALESAPLALSPGHQCEGFADQL